MEITYLGHSCFKLKGKTGTVVCDPYEATVGFAFPTVSADIVTCSHDHSDHNAVTRVKGTARREKPFVATAPGEYEVAGVSLFGHASYHDTSRGTERGRNTIFTIFLDQLRICHLGDLGHLLTDDQKSEIGAVDVLLLPVGGHFTIGPEQAVKLVNQLDPSYVIPMHYRTPEHNMDLYADLKTLDQFLNEYGVTKSPVKSIEIAADRLPEETEVVVSSRS